MEFPNTFRAFASRNYRFFFVGQLVSRMGTWMQRTAVIWVVYTITHSMLMVGVATFAEQFPSFILSPAGGITADRHDRNKVVIATQIASALQAVLLTCIFYYGNRSILLILSLSLFLGIANAYDIPARQAMVNDLVTRPEDLSGAIAMNSSLNNFTRLTGPALAGIVMAKFGATICFALNALSYLAVIYCLFRLKIPKVVMREKNKKPWTNFREGWYYTRQNREIAMTLSLAALISFWVVTYNTLQPFFARDVFGGNSATFGYITASTGLGAFVCTMFIASLKDGKHLKQILLYNLAILGVGLILMSSVHFFSLYLLMSFFCGFGTMSVMPICNTIVQTISSAEMRGRVVGFLVMATMGTIAIGSLFIGWLAKIIGPSRCQLLQGILCLLIVFVFSHFLKNGQFTKIKEISSSKKG